MSFVKTLVDEDDLMDWVFCSTCGVELFLCGGEGCEHVFEDDDVVFCGKAKGDVLHLCQDCFDKLKKGVEE